MRRQAKSSRSWWFTHRKRARLDTICHLLLYAPVTPPQGNISCPFPQGCCSLTHKGEGVFFFFCFQFISRIIFLLYQNKTARWCFDKLLVLLPPSSTTHSSSHARQREIGKSQLDKWLKAMMTCRDYDSSSAQLPDPKPNFSHLVNYKSPKVKHCDLTLSTWVLYCQCESTDKWWRPPKTQVWQTLPSCTDKRKIVIKVQAPELKSGCSPDLRTPQIQQDGFAEMFSRLHEMECAHKISTPDTTLKPIWAKEGFQPSFSSSFSSSIRLPILFPDLFSP